MRRPRILRPLLLPAIVMSRLIIRTACGRPGGEKNAMSRPPYSHRGRRARALFRALRPPLRRIPLDPDRPRGWRARDRMALVIQNSNSHNYPRIRLTVQITTHKRVPCEHLTQTSLRPNEFLMNTHNFSFDAE